MSNIQRFENLKQIVQKTQSSFDELAKIHNAVNYKREAAFALQILENNEFIAGIATKDPDSLKNAIINVAAIGLSLSPVHKLAYLLPRNGKVCLDISYQGLIQLGIDCGAIKWCKADLVYANDNFVLNGLGKEITHEFKPFSKDRGEVVGGYCTAKTPDGDFITTIMDIEEIHKIRGRSESFKKGGGPWKTDESEMIKKTLIRRCYKSWPKVKTQLQEESRLDKAMHLNEQNEIIDVVHSDEAVDPNRAQKLENISHALVLLEKSQDKYISHLCTVYRREIKKLEDLTDLEITQALVMLDQWIEQKKKRDGDALKLEELSSVARKELESKKVIELSKETIDLIFERKNENENA